MTLTQIARKTTGNKWGIPFWGTASFETGLHLSTGDLLFLCFAALFEAPRAPSITNEGKIF